MSCLSQGHIASLTVKMGALFQNDSQPKNLTREISLRPNGEKKTCYFDFPRDGSSVFWELLPMAKFLVQDMRDANGWFRQVLTPHARKALIAYGLHPDHHLVERAASRAKQHEVEGLVLVQHTWMDSLAAAHWCCIDRDEERITALLDLLLSMLPETCEFDVPFCNPAANAVV
eukprot:2111623-Amphidinium_carterae.1